MRHPFINKVMILYGSSKHVPLCTDVSYLLTQVLGKILMILNLNLIISSFLCPYF